MKEKFKLINSTMFLDLNVDGLHLSNKAKKVLEALDGMWKSLTEKDMKEIIEDVEAFEVDNPLMVVSLIDRLAILHNLKKNLCLQRISESQAMLILAVHKSYQKIFEVVDDILPDYLEKMIEKLLAMKGNNYIT